MKTILSNLLIPLVAVVGACGFADCNSGCKPAETPADCSKDVNEYQRQLDACVQDAGNKRDEIRCRDAVNVKCGLCPADTWPYWRKCE